MFTQLLASGEYFVATFWAFVPAIIAIILALITKQVYLSLFAGIFAGAMFLANGNPMQAIGNLFVTMANQLGNNGCILIFLVILGIFSVLMIKTGGSKAYGEWAGRKIKNPTGAQLSTIGFGCLIFVDDYFNCLTVGSVMRPVTDKFKISRAKLAYLIDSTAAPVCIIAPISSWAAAVSGYGDGGIMAFIKTIPFNVYALFTIAMMVIFVLLKMDFFKMKRNQKKALEGDLTAGENDLPSEDYKGQVAEKGKIASLLVPIITLIVCCIGSMIYNGYFYDWDTGLLGSTLQSANVAEAFSNCDAGSSLALGSAIALVISFIYLIATKAISFKSCMESIPEGFKSMVPAILILTFAWTLCALMGAKGAGIGHDCVDGWLNIADAEVVGGACSECGTAIGDIKNIGFDGTLNAKGFIQQFISADSMSLGVIPFVFFVLACFISFATGTSWGTFGTLLPIAIAVMPSSNAGLYYITLSAVLAGAVYGDHVSPISDTTIMASSGAQCNHIDHVKTQFPYASIVAVISAITYLIGGFTAVKVESYGIMVVIVLAVAAVLMAGIIVALYYLNKSNKLDIIEEKISKIFSKKKKTIPQTIAGEDIKEDEK